MIDSPASLSHLPVLEKQLPITFLSLGTSLQAYGFPLCDIQQPYNDICRKSPRAHLEQILLASEERIIHLLLSSLEGEATLPKFGGFAHSLSSPPVGVKAGGVLQPFTLPAGDPDQPGRAECAV